MSSWRFRFLKVKDTCFSKGGATLRNVQTWLGEWLNNLDAGIHVCSTSMKIFEGGPYTTARRYRLKASMLCRFQRVEIDAKSYVSYSSICKKLPYPTLSLFVGILKRR